MNSYEAASSSCTKVKYYNNKIDKDEDEEDDIFEEKH